jgi:hypothetical protein
MKTYIKFNLQKGQTRESVCEDIARHMWQFVRLREIDGKIGEENTMTLDVLRTEIAKYINKKNYVTIKDRMNIDRYQMFIERQMRQSINKLITPSKENTFFYPGFLNNPFVGYFIAANKKEVRMVHDEKQNHIDGCTHNLESRTHEANKHVDFLESGEERKQLKNSKDRLEVQ